MNPTFETLLYGKDSRNPRIARITLNRPQRLNAISPAMPGEIRRAPCSSPTTTTKCT